MPIIRSQLEDFVVEEIPRYDPEGAGPFLWLWLEKRGRNTHEVASALASGLDLAPRDVGWAGRKDRSAVTRQAITLPATAKGGAVEPRLDRLLADGIEGVEVLRVDRCRQRLRAGDLDGNRFWLIVRDVDPELARDAEQRLADLERRGLPNRFGSQRYGRDGRNVERGLEILRRGSFRGDRRRAMFMISAVQSKVFDAILDERPVDRFLVGDLAVVHATGDWLRIADPEAETERLERFSISPTGPLFGTKVKRPEAEALALEQAVVRRFLGESGLGEPLVPPRGLRLTGDRRPLRVRPTRTAFEWRAASRSVALAFSLPSGSYATVLAEALFGEIDEGDLVHS